LQPITAHDDNVTEVRHTSFELKTARCLPYTFLAQRNNGNY